MSRIYQPANKTTQSVALQAPVVSNKPVAPSNVKLYVNNLNNSSINKSGSLSPSLPTNSSSSSSLSSSFTGICFAFFIWNASIHSALFLILLV